MGNCCRPFGLVRKYSSRFRQRKIVLLLVGLDNAGKSSTAKGLSKEPVENVIPTVGFNVVKLFHRGYSVIIYDLGGGAQIRDIWGRYFADVHGVIFVVDASDRDRLDECKKVFEELLVNETLAGKPVLLLANKQDKAGAFDELDIVEKLNVERLVNMQQCPTLVETCSAAAPVNGGKRKLDPGIDNGYRWLLRRIIKDYDVLNKRVLADQEVQRLAIERERAEIRRRIEERREKENEEDHSDEGVCSPQLSNPFQPIQVLVKEMEEKEKLKKIGNGKHRNEEQRVDEVIDLESSKNSEVPSSKSESAVDAIREQLRQKSAGQRKRRQILHRNNRTAPVDEEIQLNPNSCPLSPEPRHSGALPPIRPRGPPPQSWAIVSNGKLVQNGFAWDLEKSLDIVLPAPNGKHPQTGGSDSDDVITQLR